MKRMKFAFLSMIAGVAISGSVMAQSDLNTADYSDVPYKAAKQDMSINMRQWGVAVATYSFAFDGGAVGAIDLDVQIPTNAIVYNALVDVIDGIKPVAVGATNALTLNSYGDILAGGTNVLTSNGITAGIPVSAATSVLATADRKLYLTRTGTAATSGVVRAYLFWVQSLPR